jgi:Uma2 family endonuclease
MSEAARKVAKYEDLYSIPENMTGEIIEGELIVTPRPAPKHMLSTTVLGGKIVPPYQFGEGGGPGGWIILVEVEVKLREDVLVPDLAGWRKERFPKKLEANWIETPPDWVCEVLSPSTALRDRTVKKAVYEAHRVGHLWLVDPVHMTVEVFRLEADRYALAGVYGGQERVRLGPFQEIEIDLGDLWIEG